MAKSERPNDLPKRKAKPRSARDQKALAVERTMAKAVRKAVLEHKRAGSPICTLVDGKVKWIKPEDI